MKKDYTMIEKFISNAMKEATYQHKEGTASSYYWQNGSKILPNRLSISKGSEMNCVQRKGRNMVHPVVGQLLGRFTMVEESPLKQHKPFNVRTQIWQVPLYPLFIGYGTLGISSESGKVTGDTGDLVVLYTPDQWTNIVIFYFAGMGNINDMEQVMKHLQRLVENGQYNERWHKIHLLPEETAQAAVDVGARQLITSHNGKFALALHGWKEPFELMTYMSKDKPYERLTPMIGEKVYIGQTGQKFSNWWNEMD